MSPRPRPWRAQRAAVEQLIADTEALTQHLKSTSQRLATYAEALRAQTEGASNASPRDE